MTRLDNRNETLLKYRIILTSKGHNDNSSVFGWFRKKQKGFNFYTFLNSMANIGLKGRNILENSQELVYKIDVKTFEMNIVMAQPIERSFLFLHMIGSFYQAQNYFTTSVFLSMYTGRDGGIITKGFVQSFTGVTEGTEIISKFSASLPRLN